MKTNNELKIENVIIKKDSRGLIFIIPQNFDGDDFRKFKNTHKKEIKAFKENI